MSLIPKPSVLDSGLIAGAQAAHHFATVLKSQWQAFWHRTPETVAAELNADVARSLQIFALNSQSAQAVNAVLDAVGDSDLSNRAPDAMPEGWAFDGTAFTYTAPVLPQAPEPEEPTP